MVAGTRGGESEFVRPVVVLGAVDVEYSDFVGAGVALENERLAHVAVHGRPHPLPVDVLFHPGDAVARPCDKHSRPLLFRILTPVDLNLCLRP